MSTIKAEKVKKAIDARLAEDNVGKGSVFGNGDEDGFCIVGIGLAAVGVTPRDYNHFDFRRLIPAKCSSLTGASMAALFGCDDKNLYAFTKAICRAVSLNDGIIFGDYYAVSPESDQPFAGNLLVAAIEEYATD